jgi:hypothetical protein
MASGVWRTSEARLLSDAPGVDLTPGVQPPADKHAFINHLPAPPKRRTGHLKQISHFNETTDGDTPSFPRGSNRLVLHISLKGILEDSRAIEAISRELLGHGHLLLAYMMLALVSGFFGVLLSPLHLCLLLSNAYFKTTLAPVYRLLGNPARS